MISLYKLDILYYLDCTENSLYYLDYTENHVSIYIVLETSCTILLKQCVICRLYWNSVYYIDCTGIACTI